MPRSTQTTHGDQSMKWSPVDCGMCSCVTAGFIQAKYGNKAIFWYWLLGQTLPTPCDWQHFQLLVRVGSRRRLRALTADISLGICLQIQNKHDSWWQLLIHSDSEVSSLRLQELLRLSALSNPYGLGSYHCAINVIVDLTRRKCKWFPHLWL